MASVKLRCIMGYPGLKISYQEKGLIVTAVVLIKCTLEKMLFTVATLGGLWARGFFQKVKKLAVLFGFYESPLDFQRGEENIFFMRSKIYF